MSDKTAIQHTDILGNQILETSKLAVALRNRLAICSILSISPKMIRVIPVTGYRPPKGYLVYPKDSVVVDGPDVLAYILSGNNRGK